MNKAFDMDMDVDEALYEKFNKYSESMSDFVFSGRAYLKHPPSSLCLLFITFPWVDI